MIPAGASACGPRDPHAVDLETLALLLRRITRPLAALTRRVETFAETRAATGQLEPSGPDDTRRLL